MRLLALATLRDLLGKQLLQRRWHLSDLVRKNQRADPSGAFWQRVLFSLYSPSCRLQPPLPRFEFHSEACCRRCLAHHGVEGQLQHGHC